MPRAPITPTTPGASDSQILLFGDLPPSEASSFAKAMEDRSARPSLAFKHDYTASRDRADTLAHQLKSLGLSGKDLSRRDPAKVAQYEVLENDAKRRVRPARDDRNVRL
jgi:hypothetical protein